MWGGLGKRYVLHPAKRQLNPEGTALAGLAVDPDGTAHQFHQLFTDRQPEAGATETPGDAAVRLPVGLKQAGYLLRKHANAGVFHLEAQPDLIGQHLQRLHAQCDTAHMREFDRIADKIQQHLLKPQRIAT